MSLYSSCWLFATAALLTLTAAPAWAQTPSAPAPAAAPVAEPAPVLGEPNAAVAARALVFKGAPARKAHYRAIYQLNSNDPKVIAKTLQAMKAALDDPRLKGKLALELVVFSGGTTALRKNQPYEADVLALQKAGVILSQCENSMKAQQLTRDDMLPYISYVPTANGELIIRQADGWALFHL
ncbi:DsrE family protein [Hymenobacter actinosclerus]|uniref:Intracellular sulfur oxidation protein, DsrE/DsrF family n=1 Tax=Hymenobacter actinosclerus TaxID=82805 RepID=A0A1I0HGL5_9BACT|nr:DsrE family protein [Hymenobacter actinosclerus]SET82123.1 hypothetical protein SAMN04487998_2889 [Hymenobacter actinosclerus]